MNVWQMNEICINSTKKYSVSIYCVQGDGEQKPSSSYHLAMFIYFPNEVN